MFPFREDPGLTFAGFLLLIALGAVYWKSAPLESARPAPDMAGSYTADPEQGVSARLWQDPFKAVFTQCPGLKDHLSKATPEDDVSILSCGTDPRNGPRRMLPEDLWQHAAGKRILILPTLVWPGAHVEVEERRRRIRYAVLSALIEACYAPRDSERLGVLLTPVRKDGKPLPMPFEWYDREPSTCPDIVRIPGDKHEQPPDSVLVLWLDDAQIGKHPFRNLDTLLKKTLPSASKLAQQPSLAIIGPARSDTLRDMVRERDCPSRYDLAERFSLGKTPIRILSPHATVADAELLRDIDRLSSESSLEEVFSRSVAEPSLPMQFLRTVRNDEALINALVSDLQRRGIAIPEGCAYSRPILPLIPRQSCHPFHSKVVTDSRESCHPLIG